MFMFISYFLVHVFKITNIRKVVKGTSVSGSFVEETLHENYSLVRVSVVCSDVKCKRNKEKQ